MEVIMGVVIFVLMVIGVGHIISMLVPKRPSETFGALKVYVPDIPDESPYLYLELDVPISVIAEKSEVVFRVDMQNLNTQK